MSPLAGPGPAHGGQRPFVPWELGWESWENQRLRGENKRPPPTHRTAIFSHSQGARIEGTKPSVLDRLPCWGRWLGGSWGQGVGRKGRPQGRAGRPALGSMAPGTEAGGRWETGPPQGGGTEVPNARRACALTGGDGLLALPTACQDLNICLLSGQATGFPLSQADPEDAPSPCCLSPLQLQAGNAQGAG